MPNVTLYFKDDDYATVKLAQKLIRFHWDMPLSRLVLESAIEAMVEIALHEGKDRSNDPNNP